MGRGVIRTGAMGYTADLVPHHCLNARETQFNNSGSAPVLAERGRVVCLDDVSKEDQGSVQGKGQKLLPPADCPLYRMPFVRLLRRAHTEVTL